MQTRLNSLYEETWRARQPDPANDLYDSLRGPDLVWVAQAYLTAETNRRVLLIGQQLDACDYSYREFLCDWTIARALECYKRFNFGEHYNASQFWTFYNQLRRELFGSECERGIIGWTNLLKFVTRDRTSVLGMPFEAEALELQGDVFAREIAILEPDVCVFVTGPDFDRIINRYYPGVLFEDSGLGTRTLAVLRHEFLPLRSFRTYHPRPLRTHKKWPTVFPRLVDLIKYDWAI